MNKMVIEEDIFYDVNGNEVSRRNLVQQKIDYYNEKRQIGETRITDFNEGSEIRNFLEDISIDTFAIMENQNELTKIAFVETAEGEWLDKHGANPFVALARNPGSEAKGFVTFTIPEAQSTDVIIPLGTVVVSTENSLQYVTDSDLVIAVGETSITGSCTCLTVGVDGNCASGTVTIIEDETLGVNGITVTNAEDFSEGEDYEEDDDYRERLLAFKRKDDFGSLPYYTDLCENVDGVHDVVFVDAEGYTQKVLVNGNEKPTPNTVLADVLEVLTIPDNIILNHTFAVDKPDYVIKNVVVNLGMSVELDDDDIEEFIRAIFDGGSALVGFEFEGLSIGQGITKQALYENFYLIEYVESIEITVGGTEITDLTVDSDEVLQLGTVTVNQTVST